MALVKTGISEERITSIIREKTIDWLGTMLAVTSNSDGSYKSHTRSHPRRRHTSSFKVIFLKDGALKGVDTNSLQVK
jgi:hypothetical protein